MFPTFHFISRYYSLLLDLKHHFSKWHMFIYDSVVVCIYCILHVLSVVLCFNWRSASHGTSSPVCTLSVWIFPNKVFKTKQNKTKQNKKQNKLSKRNLYGPPFVAILFNALSFSSLLGAGFT